MLNWFCSSHDEQNRKYPSVNFGTVILIAVMVLSIVGIAPRKSAPDDAAAQVDNSSNVILSKDCQLMETLTYQPCSHAITKREALPTQLIGKTRSDLEDHYDGWRVTSFSSKEVQLTKQLDLFCPQHIVLKADESGMLCIWQNTYGDAMSLVRSLDIPLSDFPDDVQEQLRLGIAFDTTEALTQWLESAES